MLASDEAGALELWDLTSGGIAERFEEVLPTPRSRVWPHVWSFVLVPVIARRRYGSETHSWLLDVCSTQAKRRENEKQCGRPPSKASFASPKCMIHYLWVIVRCLQFELVLGLDIDWCAQGDLDAKAAERFTPAALPSWFAAGVHMGGLCLTLESPGAFGAEVYAQDLGCAGATDDLKLNLGEQLLRVRRARAHPAARLPPSRSAPMSRRAARPPAQAPHASRAGCCCGRGRRARWSTLEPDRDALSARPSASLCGDWLVDRRDWAREATSMVYAGAAWAMEWRAGGRRRWPGGARACCGSICTAAARLRWSAWSGARLPVPGGQLRCSCRGGQV